MDLTHTMDKLTDSTKHLEISTPSHPNSKSASLRRKLKLHNEGGGVLKKKMLEPESSGRVLRPRRDRQPSCAVAEPSKKENSKPKRQKTFVCPECNRDFKDQKKLKYHIKVGHKVPLPVLDSPPTSAEPDLEACLDDDMNDVINDENADEHENIEPPANQVDVTSSSASMLRYIQDCENFRKDNATNQPPAFQPMSPSTSSSSPEANNASKTCPQQNTDAGTPALSSSHVTVNTLRRSGRILGILASSTPPSQFSVQQNAGPIQTPVAPSQLLHSVQRSNGLTPLAPHNPQQQNEGIIAVTYQMVIPCSLCNLQFFTKSALKNHYECHEGMRPFPCPVCYYSYKTETELLEHYNSKHSGDAFFECGGCRKKYKTNRGLQSHKILKHCNTPTTSTS